MNIENQKPENLDIGNEISENIFNFSKGVKEALIGDYYSEILYNLAEKRKRF